MSNINPQGVDLTTGTTRPIAPGDVVTDSSGTGIGTVSFPILAPNGVAGAPSYSFSSDATTGMYTTGSRLLNFSGSLVTDGGLYIDPSSSVWWNGITAIRSPSSGILTFVDSTTVNFNRFQLGGTTASFPAIKRNGTALNFRLADDSADTVITASSLSPTTHGTSLSLFAANGLGAEDGGSVQVNGGTGGATSGNGGAINITSGSPTNGNGGDVSISSASGNTAGRIFITAGNSTSGFGGQVFLEAGNGPTGGIVTITSGTATTATNSGGNINLIPGAGLTTGQGGTVNAVGGASGASGIGGNANLGGGSSQLNNGGGTATVYGGVGGPTGPGGYAVVQGGSGGTTSGGGGQVIIQGGVPQAAGVGGKISIIGGNSLGNNAAPGSIVIDIGASTGNNANGTIVFKGPPIGSSGTSVNTSINLWSMANTGTLSVATGLTPGMTHIQGPSDTGLVIASGNLRNVILNGTGGGYVVFEVGGVNQAQFQGSGQLVFQTSTSQIIGGIGGTFTIQSATTQPLQLTAQSIFANVGGGSSGFQLDSNATLSWNVGSTFTALAPEILGPTDQPMFVSAGGPINPTSNGQSIQISAADGGATSGTPGTLILTAGNAGSGASTANGAYAILEAGGGGGTSGTGGAVTVRGGVGNVGFGGLATLLGGSAFGMNMNSGGVVIDMGNSTGNAIETILFNGPPTGSSGSGTNLSVTLMSLDNNGGLYMAGATGGNQGAGTINATGLYVNGAAVTSSQNLSQVLTTGNATGTHDIAVSTGQNVQFVGGFGGFGTYLSFVAGVGLSVGCNPNTRTGSAFNATRFASLSQTFPTVDGNPGPAFWSEDTFTLGANYNGAWFNDTFQDGGIVNAQVTNALNITPTIDFTAGTGHYEALTINVTETNLPAGTNYLIRAQANGVDQFSVTNIGNVNAVRITGPSSQTFNIVAGASQSLQLAGASGQYTRLIDGFNANSASIGQYSGASRFFCDSGVGSVTLGAPSLGWGSFYLDYTNTATVGAVTINKPTGRVNIAATGSSVVVTNSLVTAASKVFCSLITTDTTATNITTVIPTVGSFTVSVNAPATAQISIDFFVVNTD